MHAPDQTTDTFRRQKTITSPTWAASLKIPIDTPVQFSSLKTSENIVFLQFAMNLSFAEHDKMIDAKMCLMKEMMDNGGDRVFLQKPAQIRDHLIGIYNID